jgi:signal peptidase II
MHFFLPLVLVLFFLDIASKYFAQVFLSETSIVLIENFFSLTLAFNTGVAFSFPLPHIWQMIISIIFFILIIWWARKYFYDLSYIEQIGISIFFSGALANFWERLIFSHVTDFISLHFYKLYFPIFNIADMCIFIGIILWMIGSFRK